VLGGEANFNAGEAWTDPIRRRGSVDTSRQAQGERARTGGDKDEGA